MEGDMPETPKKMPGKKKVVGLRVSSDCNQGGRKYMEDVISIVFDRREDSDYACFAVFDGHGGRQAAVFARDHLWENIKKQRGFFTEDPTKVMAAIKEGFLVTQAAMEKVRGKWPLTATGYPSTAGTTVAMVVINKNNMYVAHVGDSRIVAGVKNKHGRIEPKALTIDHKPSNRSEIERIEKLGGQVLYKNGVPRVVWTRAKHSHRGPIRRSTHVDHIPFLAVARSLGDLWSYQFEHEDYLVSPEPDITHHIIDPEFHRFLVIGSDGLWNMMSVYDAVRHVDRYAWERVNKGSSQPMYTTVSKQLVQTTINKWNARALRADNTTVITVFFEFPDRLGDEEDELSLASIREWREIGLKVTDRQMGYKPELISYTYPRRFNPYAIRKCWHYNFTAKSNELCNTCRQILEQERVRAYSSEQTVYMHSPTGPWITAKKSQSELKAGKRKRDDGDDKAAGGPHKKHRLDVSHHEVGDTPNKEIMVKTVRGMVKVQIYGFGKKDHHPGDEEDKKDDEKESDQKEEERKEEEKNEPTRDNDDNDKDKDVNVKKVEEPQYEKVSSEKSAELANKFEEEKRQTREQSKSDEKSQENGAKDSPKTSSPEADEAPSKSDSSEESKELSIEKAKETVTKDDDCKEDVASSGKKKQIPVSSPPVLRKSPRTSSKLTCLKDSNSVSPVIKSPLKSRPYNTRNSLSPKGAIKRPLRTVNSKTPGRQRSPAKAIINRAVTRSTVKIR